jgi:23S rRNA (uracil1939-C5)-methyltransferase
MRASPMSEHLLHIERLGRRGEGIARNGEGLVFVPYALPDETVLAEVTGNHAKLVEIIQPSVNRVSANCPHYGLCGGCPVQTLSPVLYDEWKRSLVTTALRGAGIECEVAPLIHAHGAGRRRVTFHARMENCGAKTGFMRARSHEIVEIDACPLLADSLSGALPAARAVAEALAANGNSLDVVVNAAIGGLDVDIRGVSQLPEPALAALVAIAERHDLARLSLNRRLVALRRPPKIRVGEVTVALPPAAFLQATEEGEKTIARLVSQAVEGSKRIADLFCGLGAFALRLAPEARVDAYDSDAGAVAALTKAAHGVVGLRPLRAERRDLFNQPLDAGELSAFDAVVFDPPRAGAEAQTRALAVSKARRVVAVSCNPASFARDAKILLEGGFRLLSVTPIDQFRYSSHVETVAVFLRPESRRAAGRLLSR